MNPVEALGAVGWTYKSVFKRFFQGSLWVPFLVVLLSQVLCLVFLLSFHKPWAQALGVPFMEWVGGGEAATHYPFSYQVLPIALARLELVSGVFVASLATAVATMLFAKAFGKFQGPASWGAAFRRYLPLILYSLILTAVIYAAFSVQRLVPSEQVLTDRTLRWGSRLGALGLAILLETLLIYTVAWMFLRGKNVFQALGASIQFSAKHFLPTVLFVAIPILFKYPLSWLSSRTDIFLNKFQPETITALIGIELFVELILGFLLVGTATFYFIWRQEEQA